MNDARIDRLERSTEKALGDVNKKLDGIADILQTLVRIEERQVHTAIRLDGIVKVCDKHEISLEKHGTRLQVVEEKMPGLLETRGWVISGILTGLGMIFAGVCTVVFGRFK